MFLYDHQLSVNKAVLQHFDEHEMQTCGYIEHEEVGRKTAIISNLTRKTLPGGNIKDPYV